MGIDARSATASDFDAAAQKHANAFWFWLVLQRKVGTLGPYMVFLFSFKR